MLIGEVADAVGVSTKTLRYDEGRGLIHDRTAGGYRDYQPQVLDRVAFIRHAQAAGLTLVQIGEVLEVRDGGRVPCDHVAALVEGRPVEVDRRLAQLQRTRGELEDLRQRLADLDAADSPRGTICAAVTGR